MWDATIALLAVWHGRPVGHVPAVRASDDTWEEWGRVVQAAEERFSRRQSGQLDPEDDAWLEKQLVSQPVLTRFDVAHALAWGLDAAGWVSFNEDWLPAGEILELHADDLYPITGIDIEHFGPELISRPGSLGVDLDELPHVRRHRAPRGIRVVFDARFSVPLAAVLTDLQQIVTVHPNAELSELVVPTGTLFHGVRPADVDRQGGLLTEALARSIAEGVVVVLPELAVTEALVDEMQATLDRFSGSCLVVAGSYHAVEEGKQVNVSCALLPEIRARLAYHKRVPMEGKRTKEAITPGEEVRVWTAGLWRFAIAICKDAIAPGPQELLARLGVNLLAVPAMTPKVDAFTGAVGRLVNQTQGFVAVANNPSSFGGTRVTSAVFGQPFPGRTLCWYPPPGEDMSPGPGVCNLQVQADQPWWETL